MVASDRLAGCLAGRFGGLSGRLALGRHKMSPRLSPKKTWEGYFGGVVAGVLGDGAVG